jgi:hypothetical protein
VDHRAGRSVDIGYVKATGPSVKIYLPSTALSRGRARVARPALVATPSSATGRAPTSRPTRRRRAATSSSARSPSSTPAAPRRGRAFKVPDEAIGCGFHEAVRGVLSHHMVIRGGKIANYHPYPPTRGTRARAIASAPRAVRGRGAGHAALRGERPRRLQGHRHHAHGAQLRSRACRAACTCTWAKAGSWTSGMCPCWARRWAT